jgi:hypothetical protein
VTQPSSKAQTLAPWTKRYPQLKRTLESANGLNIAVLWIQVSLIGFGAVFGALVARHEGETVIMIALPVSAVIALGPIILLYNLNSVFLRVVQVICNIEQESVLARLERENRTLDEG